MSGEEEGLTATLSEQLAPLLESELLRYLSGAIAGGAIGDIVQEVISGVIVEIIVDVFVFIGLGDLVVTSPSAASSTNGDGTGFSVSPAPNAGGPTSEVQTAGTLIAIAVFLYFLWRFVRPRLHPVVETREQRLVVDGALATISAGVVAGGLLGLTAAVIASAFVGLATIELSDTDLLTG